MSNVRDLRGKINSLQNMQKVMRAMNMISSIKLKKLYALKDSLKLFSDSIEKINSYTGIILSQNATVNPVPDNEGINIHIVVFSADKGLCGTHNSSILKALEKYVKDNSNISGNFEVTAIGNKAINFCRRKDYNIFQQSEIGERVFNKEQLNLFSANIFKKYAEGKIDRIISIANIFHSTLVQETEIKQILPFTPDPDKSIKENSSFNFNIEPDPELFIDAVSREYLLFKLQSLLLNSYLSEHSSRMTAMENATNNSQDLVNKYVSIQNHARQAAITNELIEIVSGKEALKG